MQTHALHILLATAGRHTIFKMLDSLKNQLREEDFLTIVFDAVDENGVFDQVVAMRTQFKATLSVIMEPANLGWRGHGIRNKYKDLLQGGDFIMHADDDDAYLPGTIDRIKEACVDPDNLYMFSVRVSSVVVMDGATIEGTSTATGVIPRELNKWGVWRPYYGGDKDFYADIIPHAKEVVVVPYINYESRPHRRIKKPTPAKALPLHVLIATIGRSTIFKMLDSLKNQLREEDFLTIVFDAADEDGVFDQVTAMGDQFKATLSVIMEPANLGWHGHGVRNEHNELPGGAFFMHADDDDVYAEDAIDVIKGICTNPTTLYMFGVLLQDNRVMLGTKSCGTPCGVIPRAMSNTAEWLPRYGGDVDFYRSIIVKAPKRVYSRNIIYIVRPQERNDPEGFVHSACDTNPPCASVTFKGDTT